MLWEGNLGFNEARKTENASQTGEEGTHAFNIELNKAKAQQTLDCSMILWLFFPLF